jgi:hypothetical protein
MNEILIFDVNVIDFGLVVMCDYDIVFRVIDVSVSDADVATTSVYGLFYLEETDCMYVLVGI